MISIFIASFLIKTQASMFDAEKLEQKKIRTKYSLFFKMQKETQNKRTTKQFYIERKRKRIVRIIMYKRYSIYLINV